MSRLASLIRLADAFDRQHMGKVHRVTASVQGMAARFHLEGEGDLLLERWAASKKKGVFESTFGLKVRVS